MVFPTLWDGFVLNATILVLAYALDRFLPEPPAAIHPVVWMGAAASLLARVVPERSLSAFLYGALIVVVIVGASAVAAFMLVALLSWIGPIAYVVGGAVLLRPMFAVRGLTSAARATQTALEGDQPDAARESLRSLVSRDAASLSESEVAGAAIESVAENTTDSCIAPWMAFALFGLPGAVAYRAINTLDSMIGYRGRYEYLGKAAARLDDIINRIPARMSAILLLLAGGVSGHRMRRGWSTMLRDHGLTASPNAGWTMSAMSGLLGRRLEKAGDYQLGDELPEPGAGDIGDSVRIGERAGVLGLAVSLALMALLGLGISLLN